MVWNIIKKDWKLMGRSALGVIALQLLFQLPQMQEQHFHYGMQSIPFVIAHPLILASFFLWPLAAVLWVVALVHQDPLPGTRQDWLTRPIPRRDMVLAKLLFATMVLQGSTVFGDLIQGVVSGFSLGQSLRAALVRAAIGFVILTLPALLLGVLSQTIFETVAMAAVLGAGFFAVMTAAATFTEAGHTFDPTVGSAIHWIPNLLRFALILAFGAALLVLQYRTRNTSRGRIVLAVLAGLLLCTQFVPWKPVFAVQKRLSPHPGEANGIAMNWNTAATIKDKGTSGYYPGSGLGLARPGPYKWSRFLLPVIVTGIPADSMLLGDAAQVVITDADGRNLDNSLQEIEGGGMSILREGAPNGPAVFKQLAVLPSEVYRQNHDRLVRVQTTYSLTLFKLGASYSMPAIGGDRMIPGFGHCVSSMGPENVVVVVECTQIGRAPVCATVFMEDPRDGSRNRRSNDCSPDYAPYQQKPLPDAMTRFGFISQFHDREGGQGAYAVDATKLDHAQIVIRVYEIAEHFTRVVDSPLIPLKEVAEN